jgi:hypothetical protein
MLRSRPIQHARRVTPFDGLFPLVLLAGLLTVVVNLAIPRMQRQLDDWRYGYPRTMHLVASVGHEEQPGQPTRFVAMNLSQRPVVFEIPGGDVSKTRVIELPYLFGADEDLTPVRITLGLINGDKLPDLIVNVKDEEVIYINENGGFRLISGEERAALEKAQ